MDEERVVPLSLLNNIFNDLKDSCDSGNANSINDFNWRCGNANAINYIRYILKQEGFI